ncbi:hypothetical protein ACTWJ8_40220 (plasmid) [Streptomyces sp. SDT5-1]|uniref:hypothetical protein n=1 Tax=Streptomyces sp. SDT5-1 TaxID=3406418 RepID=UPI003FD16730
MTETLIPPTAKSADDTSPLARLFTIAFETDQQDADEQSEDAKTAALDHAWSFYPDTLGKVLDEDDWTGKPAVLGAGLPPSAVSHLDGGLWLHHCTDGDEGLAFTLIAPCTCGHGYVDTALNCEEDLLQLLKELHGTGGRFPHRDASPDCGSQRRITPWPGMVPSRAARELSW